MNPASISLGTLRSIRLVGPWWQQELDTEITEEIGLVAARGFKAASCHEEKDNRTMEFIAGAKVNRGLVHRRVKRVLIVELHVEFQLSRDIASDHQSKKSAIRPLVNELVAHLIIHIDWANFSREFDGKKERFACRGNATADGIVGIIEEELRENRNVKPGLPFVVEAPFYAGVGLTHAVFGRGRRTLNPQPRILVCELDAVANAEIDVNIRGVRHRLIAVEEGH